MRACFLEVRVLTPEPLFPGGLLLVKLCLIPVSLGEFHPGQGYSGAVTLRKAMRTEEAMAPPTPRLF